MTPKQSLVVSPTQGIEGGKTASGPIGIVAGNLAIRKDKGLIRPVAIGALLTIGGRPVISRPAAPSKRTWWSRHRHRHLTDVLGRRRESAIELQTGRASGESECGVNQIESFRSRSVVTHLLVRSGPDPLLEVKPSAWDRAEGSKLLDELREMLLRPRLRRFISEVGATDSVQLTARVADVRAALQHLDDSAGALSSRILIPARSIAYGD